MDSVARILPNAPNPRWARLTVLLLTLGCAAASLGLLVAQRVDDSRLRRIEDKLASLINATRGLADAEFTFSRNEAQLIDAMHAFAANEDRVWTTMMQLFGAFLGGRRG